MVAEFKRYALALLHFFKTDEAVPAATRAKVAALGLCRDEYNRSAHWMPQLYVRSALRMVGKRVLTQADVVRAAWAALHEASAGCPLLHFINPIVPDTRIT